ncbi:golgin subfamily A member 6-like protein 22 [Thalassophryne amazonica]|uniref:golgin subfamily A member 6-like protein 22 n=1 Tax=Thalassophryne amazonica TaxID=390379 RepID=UPI0014712B43|nr:golgin subfamily A member 6-like protein 22 [Thalassophryne amazonica]
MDKNRDTIILRRKGNEDTLTFTVKIIDLKKDNDIEEERVRTFQQTTEEGLEKVKNLFSGLQEDLHKVKQQTERLQEDFQKHCQGCRKELMESLIQAVEDLSKQLETLQDKLNVISQKQTTETTSVKHKSKLEEDVDLLKETMSKWQCEQKKHMQTTFSCLQQLCTKQEILTKKEEQSACTLEKTLRPEFTKQLTTIQEKQKTLEQNVKEMENNMGKLSTNLEEKVLQTEVEPLLPMNKKAVVRVKKAEEKVEDYAKKKMKKHGSKMSLNTDVSQMSKEPAETTPFTTTKTKESCNLFQGQKNSTRAALKLLCNWFDEGLEEEVKHL